MLGVSLRHRGDELVAMPHPVAAFRAGHTTGIPLLHPWANRLGCRRFRAAGVDVDLTGLDLPTDERGLPIHGVAAGTRRWSTRDVSATSLSATTGGGSAAFPFAHDVVVDITLHPPTLTISTTLRPTSDAPVPVSFGWHPYLTLPRVPRRAWRVRLPARDHVVLDGRGLPTGAASPEPAEQSPLGDRVFDDHYRLGDDRRLALVGGGRTVSVTLGPGYRHAQVYAPAGKRFVCLEPMTAPVNALVDATCASVEPGTTFTASFEISVGDSR